MAQGPILPEFPQAIYLVNEEERWRILHRQWNESLRILSQFHQKVHQGMIGTEYTVSGTAPTSATIDLGNINLTATTQTVAKLLHNMAQSGILKVIEVP